jgi:hypothetical protein
MKLVLGTCYRFIFFSFWILFSFGFAFLYCNHHVGVFFVFFFFLFSRWIWKSQFILYPIVSSASIFPPVPISLSVSLSIGTLRVKLVNSCLFEILVFLNLKVFYFILFLFQALVFWKVQLERVNYANLFQYLPLFIYVLIAIEFRSCCNWDIEYFLGVLFLQFMFRWIWQAFIYAT